MKIKSLKILLLLGVLLLSGCAGNNIKDWAQETFYQSNVYKDDLAIAKRYLRGMRLYDQFTTLGIFDALWLSDEVRTVYSNIACRMTGKDEEASLAFLRRQISANTFFISFYVLSLDEVCLTTTPLLWTLYLDIDGKKYVPAEIKMIELPFEYEDFFGNRLNKHKQAYEVKFDRKDAQEKDILEGKMMMQLFFSTPRHYDSMVWYLDPEGKATDQLRKTEPALVEKPYKKRRAGRRMDPQTEHERQDVIDAIA